MLSENETFRLRSRFRAVWGTSPGGFELAGDRIRAVVEVGCFVLCPFSPPIRDFDLESPPIGPFPPGEYLLEVRNTPANGSMVLHRQKIVVVPEETLVRGGRFEIRIALDPPHAGEARLARLPSADSALFYFFALPVPAQEVVLVENVRTTAGRPGQLSLAGRLPDAFALRVDSVEAFPAEHMLVVTLATRSGAHAPAFVFPFEAPPLPSGEYRVEVRTRPHDSQSSTLLFTTDLEVHLALAAWLEPWPAGGSRMYLLHLAGESSGPTPAAQPVIDGGTIRYSFHLGCDLDCGPGEPPITTWGSVTSVGPLAPGDYTLEILRPWLGGEDPRINLRQEVRVGSGEDREGDPAARLQGGAFRVSYTLDPPNQGFVPKLAFATGADAAVFYFFSPANWEATVKVLDGCSINGFYWVFAAASTDVGYTLWVEGLRPGVPTRQYRHPAGSPAPALTDTAAFPCL